MEEQLVSYEVAKLAKEKEYPQNNSMWYYTEDGKKQWGNSAYVSMNKHKWYVAPTQSLLQKWLREVHNVHIIVVPYIDDTYDWETFSDHLPLFDIGELYFDSYEEALESALEYMLLMV